MHIAFTPMEMTSLSLHVSCKLHYLVVFPHTTPLNRNKKKIVSIEILNISYPQSTTTTDQMGSDSDESRVDQDHHLTKIWEVNKERIASMHQKISEPPRLLSNAAGRSSCCIFRVPQSLIDINGKSYQPHIVSIGPYHRGEPNLKMIEEHKWRYLGSLLHRTKSTNGLTLEDYIIAIQPLEMKARECYSETIHLNTDEFLEMMVLDGCFIIELFRKVGQLVPVEFDDPLFTMSWVFPFFLRDLLRLENQIPFFVLQRLFDLTEPSTEQEEEKEDHHQNRRPTLAKIALDFFNNALQRPDRVVEKYRNIQGKHLLDLLRSTFIPRDQQDPPKGSTPSHIIQCVSKLRRSGIKLNPGHDDSFLVVQFKRGVIEMPTITIDDFMCSFLLNCVAFEQCHRHCSKHMTTYATLLDSFINTSKDVEYLCDCNIIENYFGTDSEVARFINNLGKDVTFDVDRCYLTNLFSDVHQYYRNSWHVQYAGFKYMYFDTPWSFISAFAAFILLILTLAQTFYSVYGYYVPDP